MALLAPRDDVLTPKRLLLAGLATCAPEHEPVVLYTCGSLCPIHRQHVQIQEFAKARLEADHPLTVVAGFIASSNDLYVESKYRHSNRMESFLDWRTRAALIDAALTDHAFIVQDRWMAKTRASSRSIIWRMPACSITSTNGACERDSGRCV